MEKNFENWCMNIAIRLYKLIHPILYILHRIYFFFTTQPIPLASESKGIVQKRLAYQALGRLFRGQNPYYLLHNDLEPKISFKIWTLCQQLTASNLIFHIWFILQLLNYEVVCYSHEKSHWFFHVKFWRSKARPIL